MTVTVPPEVAKIIDEEVRSGRFSTAEDFVATAVYEMARGDRSIELTDEDIDAINEGDADGERGDEKTTDEVRADLRAKYPRIWK